MNVAGRSSSIMNQKKKIYDPPTITITAVPDETPQLTGDEENENERDHFSQQREESQTQQMMAATSSSADARNLLADSNQTQRRQLPASTTISMNNPRSNNNGPPASSVVQNHQHLALTYYSQHLHPVLQQQQQRRLSELPTNHQPRPTPGSSSNAVYQVPIRARDAIATTLSALYGKLIVVMGISFPMAEVISTYIPPSFYEVLLSSVMSLALYS